jgi:hypothetical protein
VAAESGDGRQKKKAKKRQLLPSKDTREAVTSSGPVPVNDPTDVLSVPKATAHDVRHFFTKGRDGAKTTCNIYASKCFWY